MISSTILYGRFWLYSHISRGVDYTPISLWVLILGTILSGCTTSPLQAPISCTIPFERNVVPLWAPIYGERTMVPLWVPMSFKNHSLQVHQADFQHHSLWVLDYSPLSLRELIKLHWPRKLIILRALVKVNYTPCSSWSWPNFWGLFFLMLWWGCPISRAHLSLSACRRRGFPFSGAFNMPIHSFSCKMILWLLNPKSVDKAIHSFVNEMDLHL